MIDPKDKIIVTALDSPPTVIENIDPDPKLNEI